MPSIQGKRVPRCEHAVGTARHEVTPVLAGKRVQGELRGCRKLDGDGALRALVTRPCRHPSSSHAVAIATGVGKRISGTPSADRELVNTGRDGAFFQEMRYANVQESSIEN